MVEKMEGGDYRQSIDAAIKKLRELAPVGEDLEPNPDGYSLILNGVVRSPPAGMRASQLYSDETKGKLGALLPPEGIGVPDQHHQPDRRARRTAPRPSPSSTTRLSQAAQKAFTERMFYAPTNAKAQIDPKALARTAAAPENRSRMIQVDWNEIVKVRDQWNNRWRREVISAGVIGDELSRSCRAWPSAIATSSRSTTSR